MFSYFFPNQARLGKYCLVLPFVQIFYFCITLITSFLSLFFLSNLSLSLSLCPRCCSIHSIAIFRSVLSLSPPINFYNLISIFSAQLSIRFTFLSKLTWILLRLAWGFRYIHTLSSNLANFFQTTILFVFLRFICRLT